MLQSTSMLQESFWTSLSTRASSAKNLTFLIPQFQESVSGKLATELRMVSNNSERFSTQFKIKTNKDWPNQSELGKS